MNQQGWRGWNQQQNGGGCGSPYRYNSGGGGSFQPYNNNSGMGTDFGNMAAQFNEVMSSASALGQMAQLGTIRNGSVVGQSGNVAAVPRPEPAPTTCLPMY